MTKILRGPDRAGAIVGSEGKLRVAKAKVCHGYVNGCACKSCAERETRSIRRGLYLDADQASSCECDRPLPDAHSDICCKCGKSLPRERHDAADAA